MSGTSDDDPETAGLTYDDVDPAALDLPVDDTDELAAAMADVRLTLQQFGGDSDYDLNDPADLERLRQSLPTEPARARLLSIALPAPLRETFEYVEGSRRQSAYWRCAPERSDPEALSAAKLRQRYAFMQANMDRRGMGGTVTTADGRRVSAAAQDAADDVRGMDFHADDDGPTETERRRGKRLLDRMKKVLSR